ncbi:MAG TPA: M48 family metallopeptidase [Terriglobales bacterium]|nr:M48 family metallopeptidase [Terriglobales bacterium]
MSVQRMQVRVTTLLLAGLIMASCAGSRLQQAPTGRIEVQPGGFNQFSPEQEVELGKENAQQVKQEMPILPNSNPISQYVRQLGEELAAKAPGQKWPYTFNVVEVKELNAFALPGGPVFVNIGTIRAAGNRGELAGVLAHEISHIVLRHGTSQASRQVLAQIPLAVAGVALPQGTIGQLARLGISFGAQSVFLKYSRDAESEADKLGAQIMYDAGYNPYDMVEFFSQLEKEGGSGAPQFLSDHPNPGNRAQNVSEVVSKFPKKQYKGDDREYAQIRSRAEKLDVPSMQEVAQKQQQGSEGQMQAPDPSQIRPSGQFQAFNHSAFQIAYPSNWDVFGNQSSTVTIAPRAAVSDTAIAYGVVVSGFRPQNAQSLEDATQQLIQTLQQGNPQIRVAGNGNAISVNGVRGLTVALQGPSPLVSGQQRLAEHNQLVTLPRGDGSVLFLLFIAPERDFQALQPVYEHMLQTLRLAG